MWLAREREESEMMPGFGAQGTGIIVLPWKGKKKSGVLKEVEFNLGYIEVRVLARN